MKTYWGKEVQLHAFLTPILYGGEWSSSRPSRFTPGVRAAGIHWIGVWVGPRTGSDTVGRRKNPIINPGWNWTPVVQPVA